MESRARTGWLTRRRWARSRADGARGRDCRAPSVDRRRPWAHRSDRLGPGRSAAPGEQRLTLLPSGPDVVHASPLRGTRSSTPLAPSASANAGLERGFSPAGADCRYRAPLVPRLARPGDDRPSDVRPAWGLTRPPGRRGQYWNWMSIPPVDSSATWYEPPVASRGSNTSASPLLELWMKPILVPLTAM